MLSVVDGSIHVLKSFGWNGANATLSPDGRFIAYDGPASESVGARDIFVLSADGSKDTVVVQGPANDYLPKWSPDGSRIVFFSDRTGSASLWSVPIEEGRPKGASELV